MRIRHCRTQPPTHLLKDLTTRLEPRKHISAHPNDSVIATVCSSEDWGCLTVHLFIRMKINQADDFLIFKILQIRF